MHQHWHGTLNLRRQGLMNMSGVLFSPNRDDKQVDEHLYQETPKMKAIVAAHAIHEAMTKDGLTYDEAVRHYGEPNRRILAELERGHR